jgi:hypothetical protein
MIRRTVADKTPRLIFPLWSIPAFMIPDIVTQPSAGLFTPGFAQFVTRKNSRRVRRAQPDHALSFLAGSFASVSGEISFPSWILSGRVLQKAVDETMG